MAEQREEETDRAVETREVDGSFFDYYRDYLSEEALLELGIPSDVLESEIGPPNLLHTSGTKLYDPARLSGLELDLDARLDLAPLFGDVTRFRGEVGGFDSYRSEGESHETLVLVGLVHVESGKEVADHLWMDHVDAIRRANATAGDLLEFDARVELYEKGYRGRDPNDRLEHPRQVDFQLTEPREVVRHERND